MPRFLLALPALVLSLLTGAAPAISPVSPQPMTAAVEAASYAEQLAAKNWMNAYFGAVPGRLPGMGGKILPCWHLMDFENREKFAALSYLQQLQLAGWLVPAGSLGHSDSPVPPDARPVTSGDTIMLVMSYMEEGQSFGSAREFLEWNFSHLPADKAQAQFELLMRGKPEDYPKFFYFLINPQTGKLYQSFDGSVPEPGGLIIRKLQSADDAKRVLAKHQMDSLIDDSFAGAYEIRLQGAQPGEILDSGFALQRH